MISIIICLFLCIFSPSIYSSPTSLSIHNEFIKCMVNNVDAKGRFSLETTLGNPSTLLDDHQDLIYGKAHPWSSYTTFLIDGSPFIFGDKDSRIHRRSNQTFQFLPLTHQLVSQNMIISQSEKNNILFQQSLSFLRNPNTNVQDSLLIHYTITNTDSVSHNIGVRIMLDTKLGLNDGAPFRMGATSITSEIKYIQSDLLNYWQAFDSLITPNIIAQGFLFNDTLQLTPPDSLHLANWGSLADTPWEADYRPGRSFIRTGEYQHDTALALTYHDLTLSPHESRHIKTVYGLGGVSLAPGKLSLGLSTPKQLPSNSTYPFLLVGYLVNSGGYDSLNTHAFFTLPHDLEIITGNTTASFQSLPVNAQKQLSVLVKRKGSSSTSLPITFTVSSDTFDTNTLTQTIDLLSPPSLLLESVSPLVITDDSPVFPVTMTVHNPSAFPIQNIDLTLTTNHTLSYSPFDTTHKNIHSLAPFQTTSLTWVVKHLPSDLDDDITLSSLASSRETPSSRYPLSITYKPASKDFISVFSTPMTSSKNYLTLALTPSLFQLNTPYHIDFKSNNISYVRHSILSDSPDSFVVSANRSSHIIDFMFTQYPKEDLLFLHTHVHHDTFIHLRLYSDKKTLSSLYDTWTL